MQNTHSQEAQFLVNIEAKSPESLDTFIMRDGVQDALLHANKAGTLTPVGDEATEIGGVTVSIVSTPAEALIQMLGNVIAVTPEARQAVERAVAALKREFPRERIVVLTEEDRIHLIAGMVATRQSWENSGDGWISDVLYNGYDGYGNSPDVVLLEAAFCDNPVLAHLVNDADRLGVLRILAKPEVLDIICSPERAQPVKDFDSFAHGVAGVVEPMTGHGRSSRPPDVLEALQLHGLILDRLSVRLGIEAEPEEESTAPRS